MTVIIPDFILVFRDHSDHSITQSRDPAGVTMVSLGFLGEVLLYLLLLIGTRMFFSMFPAVNDDPENVPSSGHSHSHSHAH
jgi:hypothetical protein